MLPCGGLRLSFSKNVPRRGERWKLMLKLNLRVPLLSLLLLPFLVMFLPLQKRRATKRNNKTQKTSATRGILTVLRPSAKRTKTNSKDRLVSKDRKSAVTRRSVTVRLDYGGHRINKK